MKELLNYFLSFLLRIYSSHTAFYYVLIYFCLFACLLPCRSSCHFMHLNNAHVKAWMDPNKWDESINEANTPQIKLWESEDN